MSKRAAIYCRISQDRTGEAAGVERQQRDCQEFCAQRGLDVVAVYVDNDVTAFKKKDRPQYDAMIQAVNNGDADCVVAFHLDRLYRMPKELEALIDVAEHLAIYTLAGDVDLSTAQGRLMARIVVAMAANESEDKKRRLKAQRRDVLMSGRGHGGIRAYGYEADRMTLNKAEAKIVRAMADKALKGASASQIARELNADGITTATGKVWSTATVKKLLESPRIAGLATYQGAVIGPAQWEAIITPAERESIVALFATRKRSRPAAKKRLLSGLLICGRCGARMTAENDKGKPTYRCKKQAHAQQNCGRMSIQAQPTDDHVRNLVIEHLTSAADLKQAHGKKQQEGTKAPAHDDLGALQSMRANLVDAFYQGDSGMSDDDFKRNLAKFDKRLDDERRRLAELATGATLSGVTLTTEALEAKWNDEATSLEWKRNLITAAFDSITIQPAPTGTNGFSDPQVTLDRIVTA